MAEGLKQRIQSFDWLRGVAVLFMIQCHTVMFLLDKSLMDSAFYRLLMRLDGLVAPSFIFSAGFSLALVQVRSMQAREGERPRSSETPQAAREGAASPTRNTGGRAKRVRRTLRRLGEVLAVATLVNWAWFPVFHEPKWLLRIDILHCIGLSLLIALPLMTVLAPQPRVLRWVTLALAVAVFAVTPLLRDTEGWLSLFVNQKSGAQFPLFPWAGYVYLGASAGATAASGDLRALVMWIGMLLVAGLGFWVGLGLDHPQRVFWVMGFVLVFLALEYRAPQLTQNAAFKVVTVLGTSSLAAYFLHEMMLFYGAWWAFAAGLLIAWRLPVRGALVALALTPVVAWQASWRMRGLSMNNFFSYRADWPTYCVLLAVMLAATYALVVVTDRVYKKLDSAL